LSVLWALLFHSGELNNNVHWWFFWPVRKSRWRTLFESQTTVAMIIPTEKIVSLLFGDGESVFPLRMCSFWFRSKVVDRRLIRGHSWAQKFCSFSLVLLQKLSNRHWTSFPVPCCQKPWDLPCAHFADYQLVQNFFYTPYTGPYFLWQFKNSYLTSSLNKFTSFQTLSGLTEVLGRRAWGSFSTQSRLT
jgi:hypothetical protein